MTAGGAVTVSQAISTDTGAGDIIINANAGNGAITLDAALNAGTGAIVLNGGPLALNAGGIVANDLLLRGAGPFDMDAVANDVNTLAADSVTGWRLEARQPYG